jgi:hypothetical protein
MQRFLAPRLLLLVLRRSEVPADWPQQQLLILLQTMALVLLASSCSCTLRCSCS